MFSDVFGLPYRLASLLMYADVDCSKILTMFNYSELKIITSISNYVMIIKSVCSSKLQAHKRTPAVNWLIRNYLPFYEGQVVDMFVESNSCDHFTLPQHKAAIFSHCVCSVRYPD